MNFPEEIIHYAWKMKLFSGKQLMTVSGKSVEILSAGTHNFNSGPDFDQAKIHIGDTTWAGSVEMHIRSSDWFRHNHQTDKAYRNVILHVVLEHDKEIVLNDGSSLETLVVKDLIPENLLLRYQSLLVNLNRIPCEKLIGRVDEYYQQTWLSRVAIERLEDKSAQINKLLSETKGSWDDAFYITLARNFGFGVNSLPFEMLARSLPQQLLGKHKNSAIQIQALIFGQAGFLDDNTEDNYSQALQKEYQFLKAKYGLKPVDKFAWKFMRMRPSNFPAVRLAQFSALVLKSNHLFSVILEQEKLTDVIGLFKKLPVDEYWKTHFRFGAETPKASKQIGKNSIDVILINTVIPFLFSYGKYFGKEKFVTRALAMLENIDAENNAITSSFKDFGVSVRSAETSQALLQLKKKYCDQKKCLNCGIGVKIMNV